MKIHELQAVKVMVQMNIERKKEEKILEVIKNYKIICVCIKDVGDCIKRICRTRVANPR